MDGEGMSIGDEMQPKFAAVKSSKSETAPPFLLTSTTSPHDCVKLSTVSPALNRGKFSDGFSTDQESAMTQLTSFSHEANGLRSTNMGLITQRESSDVKEMAESSSNHNCLGIEINTHGSVNRQVSSSSLCSWSSFDTALTDDNLSDNEDCGKGEKCEVLNFNTGRKKNLWGQVRKAIHWSPFVQSYRKRYPWVQLAGHDGSFKAGEKGTILKKASSNEVECLTKLMEDVLRPYVPEYKGQVKDNGDPFIQMEDLLGDFDAPSVMDCKMGTRTYLEAELFTPGKQPKLRSDLYEKMIAIDPREPTQEENCQKAITKPRYMQWRERLSSTATLGFRIEGIKNSEQKPCKDFKKTKTKEDVGKVFLKFIDDRRDLQEGYLQRLKAIRATLEASQVFASHEVIGSSLLFVHDSFGKTGVWLIDFGKTTPLPKYLKLNHREEWKEGNREDGYLIGLDNMIEIWDKLFPKT